MFAQLTRWFQPSLEKEASHRLYITLVAQARQPFFYTDLEVEDSLDGRFDMILLHLFLLSHRLKDAKSEEADLISRTVLETFISDMDRSLRELGVGDTGIARRMKKMGEALNGRLTVYADAIDSQENIKQAIKHNLFREKEVSDKTLNAFADYTNHCIAHLSEQSMDIILMGELSWPKIG
ncbi:MAG: hypothetical protein MRY32_02905 [Rickettsiales bacterium]|nr:hypothetical protein [Rickettsiales bacterium]